MNRFVINFTPTGMIPTKDSNPYTPVSPTEIIEEVLEAKKYGVSMVHLHARNKDGKPTWKQEIYKEIIDGIREEDGYTNDSLIICVSTSGRNWPEFEKRSECLELKGTSKPDMASLTLGSLNFPKSASVNSPQMIQNLAIKMQENEIRPELEVFDTGMINYAHYLIKKGIIKPPYYFNLIFGNISTSQANLPEFGAMLSNLPESSYWSSGGIGTDQLKMNLMGILNGGGVRVGLEDNIYFNHDKSKLASNMDLLKRIHDFSTIVGASAYTPSETRQILGLNL